MEEIPDNKVETKEDVLQKELNKFISDGEVKIPPEAFEEVSDTDKKLGVASKRIKLMVSFMQQLKARLSDYDAYFEKESPERALKRVQWAEEAEVLRHEIEKMSKAIEEAIAEEVKGTFEKDKVAIRKDWVLVLPSESGNSDFGGRLGKIKESPKAPDKWISFGNN